MTVVSLSPDLAALRAAARRRIDQRAEVARQIWITPGDGQAMEYGRTAEEALTAAAAADPLDPADYPMLEAERRAQAAAGVSPTPALRAIAEQVLAEEAAWRTIGAAIKERRRRAKLRIAAAASPAEIDAIVDGLGFEDLISEAS